MVNLRCNLTLLAALLLMPVACTPPAPPPSPTPQVTPSPILVEDDLAATSLSAAAIPTAAPTLEPAPATPPTSIVVWESLPQAQAETLAEHIQSFQQEFPQYNVSLQHYDSPESFMRPLMAGETDFDVALVAPVLLGNLWATEQIRPMSDLFPASFTNDFVRVALLGASRDDTLWGLPDTAGFHLLLFYNRDLVDTPPQTTAELFGLAQELTQNDQTNRGAPAWGLAVNSYEPLWLVPWLAPYGGWLTDENGQPTLNTAAMEAAITLYLSWQGRLTGIAPVATYEEARSRFLNGDIAMMIDGEWAIAELARAGKINWGVALLPNVGEAGASQPAAPLVLARYWVVGRAAGGNRALASTAFLEYITQPERQLAWAVRFGLLPTRRQALENLVIVNDSALRISAEQMLAGRTVPPGVNVDVLLNAMRQPLQQVIDGEITPLEAAEMMQNNMER
ncbi:MAG: extracellular solute-binding protein [Anaerolineae bacterium]|nr:extracellular solute-binding protein [Anaerolineae bacterium]